MNNQEKQNYYLNHRSEILKQFYTHAEAWRPFLASRYGDESAADTVLRETQQQFEILLSKIPYIGGDENPMTRYLVSST